ncbi:MAG: ribosome small subunit-dependent GTPase A [Myxococcales bacterium]|nr:ribosome small subunit-dependent GTPase A [Myxococcales bacterium]
MSLGWDAAWDAVRRQADPDGAWTPVRIAAEHRGAYHAIGDGGVAWVELTGKLYNEAADKRALPTVGDWVLVERWTEALAGNGAGIVRALLPRRTFLVRKAAGEAVTPQPLAANVDVGLVLTSANSDLSPARLDRYVGLLRDGGVEPVLVLSKVDLVPEPGAALAQLRAVSGGRVVAISSTRGEGLDELRALSGAGRTTVLLGSSGVGKSTLLNALIGTRQETRELRADERGRHTTTGRELFVAQDGGVWIDTPGMRELAQWVEEDEEEQAFDDIMELAQRCKFRDCHHAQEPDCAVRGQVDERRLASFRKLAAERAAGAARQSEAQRIATARRARKRRIPGKDD